MEAYHNIARNILRNGQFKGNRTGVRCLTTFCEVFRHDMSEGFPLLTTKKMGLKNIAVELEFFIKGLTSKKWLQERNCHIWDSWSNPELARKEHTDIYPEIPEKELQKYLDDLGPVYGYQWRNFGKQYGRIDEVKYGAERFDNRNGVDYGEDQLADIVLTLKKNPDDRRMVCSAWNPSQLHLQALPPCHYAFTLVHINGKLNLCYKIRSQDYFLGAPYNIASYALLLLLLCKESNLVPGELVGILEDCHIYENHLEQIKEQLTREPYALPSVEIPNMLKSGKQFNIFDWTYEDFVLKNYQCHPAIKADVAV